VEDPYDVSHVSWLMTANSLESLSILSEISVGPTCSQYPTAIIYWRSVN
jgi:hypothetical protein